MAAPPESGSPATELQPHQQKPKIYTIQDGFKITWVGMKSCEKYIVKITGEKFGYKELNTQVPQCVLKQSLYGWTTGVALKFSIDAVMDPDNIFPICKDEEYVVGGTRVPSTVELNYNEQNPFESLHLTWQRAKANPENYLVEVYKVDEGDQRTKIDSFTTPETQATLANLDALTKYCCAVAGKYSSEVNSEPVLSNILETQDLPPEAFKANEVQISKDAENPSRQIIVKWKETNMLKNLFKKFLPHFDVYLTDEQNQRSDIKKIEHRLDGKYECSFKNLKSNTKYTASITTFKKIGRKKSKEVISNTVTTEKANRTPGFNIEVAGKPVIQTCETKSGTLMSTLEWNLADLKTEHFNYKLLEVKASLLMKEATTIALDVENNCRCKSIKLQPGKTYTFTVLSTYEDLDTKQQFTAAESREFNTNIGCPKIENVTWSEKDITVTWAKAKGAKKHVLKIVDKQNKELHESGQLSSTTTIMPMGNQYRHGDTCTFIIEATAENGLNTQAKRTQLIGGDSAVTKVTGRAEGRQFHVSWNHPKQNPKGYKVCLFEFNGNQASLFDEDSPLEQNITSHTFINLKSSTTYCCHVSPIYHQEHGYATFSNFIKTAPRVETSHERMVNFGKTTIFRTATELPNGTVDVTLSWRKVEVGPNYKITGYRAILKHTGGWIHNPTIFDRSLSSVDMHTTQDNIPKGSKYEFKLYAAYKDLDTGVKGEKLSELIFPITPSQTNVEKCTCKDGVISFVWTPVHGATKYRLIINDELQGNKLLPDKIIYPKEEGGNCQADIQASDRVGIGRTCTTKIIAYVDDAISSTSDWKVHLIGGIKVARNVQALTYIENQFRAVKISFDSPKHGSASEYKIVALPSSGRRKTIFTQSSPSLFEYLRKGVEYKFEVWAKWGNDWSGPSLSNPVSTRGAVPRTMVEISPQNKARVDLRGSKITDESKEIVVLQGNDFGCIRDLKYTYKEERDTDLVSLNWTEPIFGNRRSDYKVEKFKVEIRKPNASDGENYYIEYNMSKQQYLTDGYKLNLGELYNVYIYTIYEDIDQDVMYVSSAEKQAISTRPCQPVIHRNVCTENGIKIEWSKVKGAKLYEVHVVTEGSTQPFITEVKATSYTKSFDETFGYGTRYYATVRACGEDDKYNETRTESNVIGGEYVPTKVTATTEHERVEDPNFQVFLKWNAPQRPPKRYQIEVISDNSHKDINDVVGETYLISHLKAGTNYYFKVKAIHEDGKVSGGCCSNKVQTNPTPTQVKRVWFQPGDNPSTSQIVFWETVEATEYRICLATYDKKTRATSKQNVEVQGDQAIFSCLHPGALYSVTVAGGNSIGFGRASEAFTFNTEWGTPKNVTLTNDKAKPSSTMIMKFDKAEGEVLHYIATLYKYQNKAEQEVKTEEVTSPHNFPDLDANTGYYVMVHAVMKEGNGKDIASNKAVTAPSKTVVTESGCCKDGQEFSSKKIFVKWRSDLGCDDHEVIIRCGTVDNPECRYLVSNTSEITYSCQNESTQYSIQIRSRNCSGLFGDVSDRVIVELAPAKLKHAMTVLTEESYDIRVSCQKPKYHSAFFFMKAFCGEKFVLNDLENQKQDTKDTIEWIFSPPEFAEKYIFELWAEDSEKNKGRITRTSPITSRPSRVDPPKIILSETSPSTNIQITWEKQPRCNMYEVQIKLQGTKEKENLSRFEESSCLYRCLSPGDQYAVSVRAISGSVSGFWSDETAVTLAPCEIEWIEDPYSLFEPVDEVAVKWQSRGVEPKGYKVKLYQGNKQIDEIFTEDTKHTFTDYLEPGSLCHCTVTACNGDISGKATKSRDYRIKWSEPDYFTIYADKNEPTRKAQMKWICPKGVNQFKLKIKNDITGDVNKKVIRDVEEGEEKIYTFSHGIPGNPYSVKLFSGCNGRYNEEFLTDTITYEPDPPTDMTVVANKEVKGLSIEYKDSPSSAKTYKITIESLTTPEKAETITTSRQSWICRNLIPGEGYKVSVITIIENVESKALTTNDYIHTFPDEVKNLRSCFEEGNIKFEWNPLNIKPDKYIVQWRVNNELITEEYTEGTSFSICCLKPATWYRLRVMACTKGNCGSVSDWKAYITRPSPPHSVQVKKDERSPQTCLVVRFEDEEDMQKRYKVTAWYNDKAAREVITKNHFAFLKDLTPGNPYIITVETLFCGEKSDIATVMRI